MGSLDGVKVCGKHCVGNRNVGRYLIRNRDRKVNWTCNWIGIGIGIGIEIGIGICIGISIGDRIGFVQRLTGLCAVGQSLLELISHFPAVFAGLKVQVHVV